MDFCFLEVIYPFEKSDKSNGPFLPFLPLLLLQNVYPYNIFPSMGSLEGHSLRLKIPVSRSGWKVSRDTLIRDDRKYKVDVWSKE